MFELPVRPSPPPQLWMQGIALGVHGFRKLFLFTTIAGFLGLLPTLYTAMRVGDIPVTPEVMRGLLDVRWGLVEAMAFVCGNLVQAIMLARLDNMVRRQEVDFRSEWQRALRALLSLVVSSLVLFVALLVGYILLIVPGVILTVSLVFFQYAVVLDGKGPIQALNRSHTLVWGNWWRTFLVLIVMALVLVGIVIVVLAPFAGLLALRSSEETGRSMLEKGVLQLVGTAVFAPFVLGIMYLQYHDLKLRLSRPGTQDTSVSA